MVEIGKINKLKIAEKEEFGVYLNGEQFGKIFLPGRDVPENYKIGNLLDVFIYSGSQGEISVTTQTPYAVAGEFAFMKVVSVNTIGVFLDWGIQKDLLVPYSEQKQKMEEGLFYIVFVYLDDKSRRIVASSKLDKFLVNQRFDFKEKQEVDLLIFGSTDIGYKAIVNNCQWGMLYKNEVFQNLKKGQKIKGFIKKVRDDGKIDVCLHKPGYDTVKYFTEIIMDKLKVEGGFIGVNDKSSPEAIYDMFGMSKKIYKKAIGSLYKKKTISIEDEGIRLKEKHEK
ncbi:MAG: GntR family transcriptional regulator [Candidatus Omnitrophica bacterium]|nr:GntR family transcriptional regulator [Candidatus Omnitrophota bacterium]